MRTKLVLALAAALLTSGAANAADIGASVNVGPLGAGVGLSTPAAGPLLYGSSADNFTAMPLTEAAVINGGITAVGPLTGGNLLGITQLPQGTLLVSGLPANETAIVLPGMVGMPSAFSGCVKVIGVSGPSALSLISTATTTAALPAESTQTHTFSQVTTTKQLVHRVSHHQRLIRHRCLQRRIMRKSVIYK